MTRMCEKHVSKKLKELEATGILTIEREHGKPNKYTLTRELQVTSNPQVDTHRSPPTGDQLPTGNTTRELQVTRLGNQGLHESYKESYKLKEEEKSTPLPPKPKKWNTTPRTLEAVNEAIEKTNVEKYREKWKDRIDFDKALEEWKRYAREGNSKKPRLNPTPWKNFDYALDDWCRKAFDWGSKPIITQTASFDAKAYNEEILREAEARRDSPRKSISEQRMELQEKEAKKLGLGLREMLEKRASHLGKSIEDYIDQDLKTLTVFKKWEDEGRC